MSIIPASRLSTSDFARLGNNLTPGARRRTPPRRRIERRFIATLNRSLACVGEQIGQFHNNLVGSVAGPSQG